MEEGLISVLTGSPAIAGGRIYPIIPQGATKPLVRYQVIDTRRIVAVDGINVGPTEFTVQLDCVGATYQQAKELSRQVLARLHTYSGTWGSSICRFCYIQSENDLYEQNGDNVTHWVAQRYIVTTNDQ
jgi:hypothetical protein